MTSSSVKPLWSLVDESRTVVDPTALGDRVVHYSIPNVDEFGSGVVEKSDGIRSAKLLLSGGEVLISKLNPRKSRVVVVDSSNFPIVSSTEFIGLRPGCAIETRFLRYYLQSDLVRQQLDSRVQSVTRSHQRVNPDDVLHLELDLVGLEEQSRIAGFLDDEISRMDKMVSIRKRQVDLISERGFSRAYDVIRGAKIAGPRVSSGLQWLGTVPQSWRVAAVGFLFDVELGKMLNQDRAVGEHLAPYLRVANVQWDEIDVTDLAYMDFPPGEEARYLLQKGDLLVCEGGSWPGRAAIWDGRLDGIYYQKALHRLRARGDDSARWLYYCLLVAERLRVFAVQGNTSTMTHLTREQLKPQRFPFPDAATQTDLAGALDIQAEADRTLICRMNSQIDLLVERKQSLITAAVTGQFDISTASGRNLTQGV